MGDLLVMQFVKDNTARAFTTERLLSDGTTDYGTVMSYNKNMAIDLAQFEDGTLVITREQAAEFFGFKLEKPEPTYCKHGCLETFVVTYEDMNEDGTLVEVKNCASCGLETRKRIAGNFMGGL